ncbi:helix-turn-helix transcriptional regulator [Litoribacillus peritrichatus]|uniref:Helix-turn-helix transcriptional regulator n=1 Tax=Litoribacillus peritrichatus TaxID=718191 RepID=A0ABP7MXG6_9GAMM
MKGKEIFLDDIRFLQSSLGLSEQLNGVETNNPVMAGRFRYHAFLNGLSMHATDAVEKQNSSSVLELPAGLSFNFMFSGKVDYSFADRRYALEPFHNQTSCSAIVNNSTEIMTRAMCKGMRVKKVNVFVERPWLESRCQSPDDIRMLNRVFSQKRVCNWLPEPSTLAKAERLLEINHASNFSEKLEVEHLTMQLLSDCINALNRYLDEHAGENKQDETPNGSTLKQDIDALLNQHLSLTEIAQALNTSERTLQRKFQTHYHQTVASYIKQRRMEKAKKALVIEGRSIGEAAYLAGYNHSSNFVNAFKKQFGMTPAEFVRTHCGLRH